MRNLAVSRIYLDNFEHITAYWVSMGLPLAQVALGYGVDDLHGTIMEEKIFHMAGAKTPQGQTVAALEERHPRGGPRAVPAGFALQPDRLHAAARVAGPRRPAAGG